MTSNIFNTAPLLNEVNECLTRGLHTILNNFMDDHRMYKDTYEGVMRLPCMRAISGTKPPQIETDNIVEQLKQQVAQLEDEIVRLKLLVNTKPVAELPAVMVPAVTVTSVTVPSVTVPSVTVPSVEKENITLVLEVDQFDNAEEEGEEKVEEEEDEEEDDEEEEDEEDEDEEDEDEEKDEEQAVKEEQVETIEQEEEEEQVETIEEEEQEEDEEQVETIEEEEQVETIEEEEQAVKEEQEESADGEEEELFEIEIDGVSYCTGDEDKGIIYELTADGEVGKKVGYLKAGEPFFY